MDYPTIDHRGPDFAELGLRVLDRIKLIFKTSEPVIIFPASGTGAWEAAIVNTLSAGDKILMFETGHFSTLWYDIAEKFKLEIDFVKGDWRTGVDPNIVEQKLKEDKEKKIKAVCAVHNETSTGVTSRIGKIRKAMDNAEHPALLFVDTISSLGSIDYRHEEWKVDVTDGQDTIQNNEIRTLIIEGQYVALSLDDGSTAPKNFMLHENYPNPFNPTTQIRFDIPRISNVTLTIYNMLGQKVRTFTMHSVPAGYHALTWNATNDFGVPVSAGLYLYQLQTEGFVQTKKMILLK